MEKKQNNTDRYSNRYNYNSGMQQSILEQTKRQTSK